MKIIIGMLICAAFLLWLGAMCMTFASPVAGLAMSLIGLGIGYVALRMGGFCGHPHLV